MKTIEELENMSFEDLEKIFDDKSVSIPSSLEEKTDAIIMASSIIDKDIEDRQTKRQLWIPATTLLAAAALSSVFVIPRLNAPKDTFTDPMEAYAQVEKALSMMAEKMSIGTESVIEATSIANIPNNTINKINKK